MELRELECLWTAPLYEIESHIDLGLGHVVLLGQKVEVGAKGRVRACDVLHPVPKKSVEKVSDQRRAHQPSHFV